MFGIVLGGRLPPILEEPRIDNRGSDFEGPIDFFIQNDANSLKTKAERNAFISRQYRATMDRIIEADHNVILIYPIPKAAWNVLEKLAEKIIGTSGNAGEVAATNPVTTSADAFKARTTGAHELLDNITDDGIIRIYPEQFLCNTVNAGRCLTHNTENWFYRDDNNRSDTGARRFAEMVMSAMEKFD